MYELSSGDDFHSGPMSTEVLEDICGSSQSQPRVNRREACYKIRYRIKRSRSEWKGALFSTQNMGKGLHKVFKSAVNDVLQVLPILGESGSEVSYFIPKPRNFAKVTRLLEDIKKPWLK